MTFSKKIISAAVLVAFSATSFAATDTTDIEINVTKDEFVNFTGSLQGNTSNTVTEAQADNATHVLGTLGTEANTGGDCDITVTSLNDFELLHTVTPALSLHSGSKYTVNYASTTFASGSANTLTRDCNSAATDFSMVSPAIVGTVQAGTYSDTITVTVVTQ